MESTADDVGVGVGVVQDAVEFGGSGNEKDDVMVACGLLEGGLEAAAVVVGTIAVVGRLVNGAEAVVVGVDTAAVVVVMVATADVGVSEAELEIGCVDAVVQTAVTLVGATVVRASVVVGAVVAVVGGAAFVVGTDRVAVILCDELALCRLLCVELAIIDIEYEE